MNFKQGKPMESSGVRRRRPKQIAARPPAPKAAWSMNLAFQHTADGRVREFLKVVNDATRGATTIELERAISGMEVTRVLDRLVLSHGLPRVIRSDGAMVFQSEAMVTWAREHGVSMPQLEPGSPNAIAPIERSRRRSP